MEEGVREKKKRGVIRDKNSDKKEHSNNIVNPVISEDNNNVRIT
jgi:hypothetical protein